MPESDVVLIHPNLPDTQTITVAPEAVPHYLRSGWEQVGNDARPKRHSQPTPAEPVPTDPALPDEIKE